MGMTAVRAEKLMTRKGDGHEMRPHRQMAERLDAVPVDMELSSTLRAYAVTVIFSKFPTKQVHTSPGVSCAYLTFGIVKTA
jgi:hypothetical protein